MSATFGGIHGRRTATTWQVVFYFIMIGISVATVVPFLFMASTSFTQSFTMMTYPPTLIPDSPSLANYSEIIFRFQDGIFPRWFFNTVLTTAAITLGSLLLNTLSGYIFAKKQFYGRNFLFALMLSTMMVPRAVTLIPAFQIINKLQSYFN